MSAFDFIIVGAGSSGCVLANRLSAQSKNRVLLLESGPTDRGLFTGFWTHLPIGYGKLFTDARVNWRYHTQPEIHLQNRDVYWPRGKVLGGSSAINAMVWARGFPSDYDKWGGVAQGWGWDNVEPVFRNMERWAGSPSVHRGTEGPQAVFDTINDAHSLSENFIKAANSIGLPATDDYNGEQVEGVFRYQLSTRGGMRASAARSYLHPVKNRQNLTIVTLADVTDLIWEGSRVSGVRWRTRTRTGEHRVEHEIATASKEILLCAGAIGSPLLMQRSGIGATEALAQHKIKVRSHNPNVGEHLQDHLGADASFRASVPTLNQELSGFMAQARAAMRYTLTRRGPLSLSGNHAGGFVRSCAQIPIPDLQLYFTPMSYSRAPSNTRPMVTLDKFPGFMLGFNPCRPTSRGSVNIASDRFDDAPIIKANYLSTGDDKRLMLKGMRLMRELAGADALKGVIEQELTPGANVDNDAELMNHIEQTAWTVFHPSCTCRMGDDPAQSVVDARLRVHSVPGLRVVDASVFPSVTSGNTNAPTMMVAERAAEMILQDFR